VIFGKMMFWVKSYMILSAFLCLKIIGLFFESHWGIGELKLGFLGEKGHKAVATQFCSP